MRVRWKQPRELKRVPKGWTNRAKWFLNQAVFAATRKTPFSLGRHDIFGAPPAWQQRLKRLAGAFLRTNFPAAIGLLAVCVAITTFWKMEAPNFMPDLWPAMGGMAFEVFFILIIFAVFEQRRGRFQEIERQREIIDDFKRWDAPEARLRIAGAIRRLNRRNVFALSLGGTTLSDFSFAVSGITSISGSTFYDGSWGEPQRETRIKLTRVKFDYLDCRAVQFSPFDPFEALFPTMERYAQLDDCSFIHADLRAGVFNGAALTWSSIPPKSLYELVDDDGNGQPNYVQVDYGPFDGAFLTGASFRGCVFKNVDFRGANGLEKVDFFRAQGLQDAYFDSPDAKAQALASADRPEEAKPEAD